ncbi:MAG: hypothetical protein ACKVYV_07975 [Limisphaerales bacterium]
MHYATTPGRLALAAAVVLATHAAQAGVIVSAVPSATSVSAGDTITVRLFIELETAADSLAAYGISLRFDNLEMELNGTATENDPSVVDPGNPLEPFTTGPGAQTNDRSPSGRSGLGDGQVSFFEAGTLDDGAFGPRRWEVGSVPFKVLTPVDDAGFDLLVGFFHTLDGMIDNNNADVTPTFVGAAIVPEPGETAVAFGLAAAGALLLRRRAGRKA